MTNALCCLDWINLKRDRVAEATDGQVGYVYVRQQTPKRVESERASDSTRSGPNRIISTVDPEMRHGRKSSSTRFDGYKVHISEAVESEFTRSCGT